MRVSGHGVDDEEDRFAEIAEVFGDRHGGMRRKAPHHRTLVARGDDGDGARPVARERAFEELAHLASALADKRHDDRVEGVRLRKHGQKRRLADAGPGEDADALALDEAG